MARTDLSSVESVRMGSAPVGASLMAALKRALPQAKVTNAYGTTEAGPVVFGPHPGGLTPPELALGYPHPLVSQRLFDVLVVANLLTNAIQYNQPGGEVRVILEAQTGLAVLTVSDTRPAPSHSR